MIKTPILVTIFKLKILNYKLIVVSETELTYRLNQDIPINNSLSPTENVSLDHYSNRNSQYATANTQQSNLSNQGMSQTMLIGMSTSAELTEPVW